MYRLRCAHTTADQEGIPRLGVRRPSAKDRALSTGHLLNP